MKRRSIRTVALGVGLLITVNAQATLIDRGSGLIYDDVLDITWLQDAGLGGIRAWDDAVMWADTLEFGGFDDWRLPSISVSSGVPTGSTDSAVNCATATEVACRDNELGYMFYQNLGGTFGANLTGNHGVIQNIPFVAWLGTDFVRNHNVAWGFGFFSGGQGPNLKGSGGGVWAVRPGDVLAAVPEPSTGLLLAAGLAGLGLCRQRLRPRRQ